MGDISGWRNTLLKYTVGEGAWQIENQRMEKWVEITKQFLWDCYSKGKGIKPYFPYSPVS